MLLLLPLLLLLPASAAAAACAAAVAALRTCRTVRRMGVRRTAAMGAMGSGRVWMRRLGKSPPGCVEGGMGGVEERGREVYMRRVSTVRDC